MADGCDLAHANLGVHLRYGLCALLMVMGSETAMNAAAAEQSESSARREVVRQKLRLLGDMVWGSPLATRIAESADTDAMAGLAEGRRLHELAEALLEDDNPHEAGRHVDQALREVALAARAAGGAQPKQAQMLAQYRRLREGIEMFMSSLAEMKASDAVSLDTLAAYNLIEAQVNDVLARTAVIVEDDVRRALAELTPISRLVEEAVANARNEQTLVYSLEFDSPADEYGYELARNDSYERLVSRLASEGNLSEGTDTIFFAVLARNERHLADARSAAEKGNFAQAIESLRLGTQRLRSSLRMAGLNI